jgi:molybdate transport system permease protein
MALSVQITKRLPDFTLDVSFVAGNYPLCILGPSGAGKSMLLRMIAGLENPDRGRIVLDDKVLLDTERKISIPARERRIAMLFQHYALFPHRSVRENVSFGLHDLPPQEQGKRVTALLEAVHAGGLDHRYPGELSGGEQQRVALARALAIDPEAMLLDEPLSALDTHLRSQVETQLLETFSAYPHSVLVVTHNIEEAYRLGVELLVLIRGKVEAFGEKEEIFRYPPTLEVARLTGCKNFSRVRRLSGDMVEALDWGCRLHVEHRLDKPAAWVGIRAHHIEFTENSVAPDPDRNIFSCWLERSSETPFRVTLFLKLHPLQNAAAHQLQAEVPKDRWNRLEKSPSPWSVVLPPESLFLLAE